MLKVSIAAVALAAASAAPSGAIPPPPVPVAFPYEVIDSRDYQVFVQNWSPASRPLCVAIRSGEDWDRVFHPAPVMRGNRAFAPPASFWSDHIILLIAREMPMTGEDAIRIDGVDEIAGRLEIRLAFHIVDASSTMNAWKGIVIGRPDWLSRVAFRAGNETVCSLETSYR